jgi:hypothetical protein
LQISFHTVHAHVRQIYRAFDVHSLTELMAKFLDRRDVEKASASEFPLPSVGTYKSSEGHVRLCLTESASAQTA